jgi:hypothetical protein
VVHVLRAGNGFRDGERRFQAGKALHTTPSCGRRTLPREGGFVPDGVGTAEREERLTSAGD